MASRVWDACRLVATRLGRALVHRQNVQGPEGAVLSAVVPSCLCDDAMKQVSICFMLMSGRHKRDYRAVLRSSLVWVKLTSKRWCPTSKQPSGALFDTLDSHVSHRGCVFHWTKAVWRQAVAVRALKKVMDKLRYVQNAAARLLTGTRK